MQGERCVPVPNLHFLLGQSGLFPLRKTIEAQKLRNYRLNKVLPVVFFVDFTYSIYLECYKDHYKNNKKGYTSSQEPSTAQPSRGPDLL